MLLLLDENLPKRLKSDFPNHQVFTVWEKGWNGIKNGELLQIMLANKFDALLTFDKNLQHQQNFIKYPVSVFVMVALNNTYQQLRPLTFVINKFLESGLIPGPIIISIDNSGT
jgi:predicted nuclease of predicted toxin-antitoxin system